MKAIVMTGGTSAAVTNDRPLPTLRPGCILVKVAAVALNPTDWKHIEFHNVPGLLCGCDYAGTVVTTGEGYTKEWREGDRVCGMVHGGNKIRAGDGAFAEYIVAKADVQMRIPSAMSFAAASTLGVGVLTAGQGLYQAMQLSWPRNTEIDGKEPTVPGKFVLVYGGSTGLHPETFYDIKLLTFRVASGALGIQLLRESGYRPITTCSRRNFDYVTSLGATAAFDYRDSDCAQQIRKYTEGSLQYAWDCISSESSVQLCADALGSANDLRYGCLLPVGFPREDVKVTHTLAYTAFGDAFDQGWAKLEEGDTRDFEFAKRWIAVADGLLKDGRLKPHAPSIREGALKGVLDGLELLKQDSVSGQKLVYELS